MAPPIRIMECIRQGLVGGGETHLLSLMEHINRNQFEPVVLSFTDGPMISALKAMNIPTHIIHTEKPFDFRIWSSIDSLIKKEKVQMLHAHGTRAASNLLWAAKRNHIPLVYTIHGWSFHKGQSVLTHTFRRMGETIITRNANINISVSASNQETGIKELKGFSSVIVNNGIDPVKFDPGSTMSTLRQELSIAPHEIVILFVARFTEHKQPLTLLKAFAEARKQNDQLRLIMVGDGDQKKEGIQLASALAIEAFVTFLPFRSDIPNVLSAGDIYVLPSLWEGLPIGLLEAMAMEKAVIGTNVDGTREVIDHMQNGVLASGIDMTTAIADAIVLLSNNADLRSQMGKNARQSILKDYNVVQMTHQIESIYKKLALK